MKRILLSTASAYALSIAAFTALPTTAMAQQVPVATDATTQFKEETKEWYQGYGVNSEVKEIRATGDTRGLSQAEYNSILSGNFNITQDKIWRLDPADQLAAYTQYELYQSQERSADGSGVNLNQATINAMAKLAKDKGVQFSNGADLDHINTKVGSVNPELAATSGYYVSGEGGYLGTPFTYAAGQAAPVGEYTAMAVRFLQEAQKAGIMPASYNPPGTYSDKATANWDNWRRENPFEKTTRAEWEAAGSPVATGLAVTIAQTEAAVPAFNGNTVVAQQQQTVEPITITIPATGTKQMANGTKIDSEGVITDATGKILGRVKDNGTILDATGAKAAAQDVRNLLTAIQGPVGNEIAFKTTAAEDKPVFTQNNNYVAANDKGDIYESATAQDILKASSPFAATGTKKTTTPSTNRVIGDSTSFNQLMLQDDPVAAASKAKIAASNALVLAKRNRASQDEIRKLTEASLAANQTFEAVKAEVAKRKAFVAEKKLAEFMATDNPVQTAMAWRDEMRNSKDPEAKALASRLVKDTQEAVLKAQQEKIAAQTAADDALGGKGSIEWYMAQKDPVASAQSQVDHLKKMETIPTMQYQGQREARREAELKLAAVKKLVAGGTLSEKDQAALDSAKNAKQKQYDLGAKYDAKSCSSESCMKAIQEAYEKDVAAWQENAISKCGGTRAAHGGGVMAPRGDAPTFAKCTGLAPAFRDYEKTGSKYPLKDAIDPTAKPINSKINGGVIDGRQQLLIKEVSDVELLPYWSSMSDANKAALKASTAKALSTKGTSTTRDTNFDIHVIGQ